MSQSHIDEIWDAAVVLGLARSRNVLLGALDPKVCERLDNCDNNADQMYADLTALSRMGVLRDGSVPLAVWLTTAYTLTQHRPEAAVFRRMRALALAEATRAPKPRRWTVPPFHLRSRSVAVLVAMSILALATAAAAVIGTMSSGPGLAPFPVSTSTSRPPAEPMSPGSPSPQEPPRGSTNSEEGCAAQWASGISPATPNDYSYPLLRKEVASPLLAGFELYEVWTSAGRVVYGVAPTRALLEAARDEVYRKGRATFVPDCRPGTVRGIRRDGRRLQR